MKYQQPAMFTIAQRFFYHHPATDGAHVQEYVKYNAATAIQPYGFHNHDHIIVHKDIIITSSH